MTTPNRELHVQGVPVSQLAEQFGTPMFVYDGDILRERYLGLRERLHPSLQIFYSLKANPNVSVCALLTSLGARAEVCSLAELETALRTGVRPEDIIMLGPGKRRDELEAAVRAGIAAVVCESVAEVGHLDAIARRLGVVADVALRVNPSFDIKGSGLTMGGKPRQFGIDVDQVLATPDLVERYPSVRVKGVHVYMGTRILDASVVVENARRVFDLAEKVAEHLGFSLELVDIGGGLGVPYFDGEDLFDRDELARGLNPVVEAFAARHPQTRLIMELGRYLTADSGTYVVRVSYVKTSMGERFAIADGGTNHHMAAVGIGSFVKRNFPLIALTKLDEPATEPWNVTGPLCTPNDTIAKKLPLPDLEEGDLLGVLRSGAYGPTASPTLFLSHGYPAEVLVDGGRAYLVRERDTAEDMLARQHLVELSPAYLR